MTGFKVGDKVRVKSCLFDYHPVGSEGVIEKWEPSEKCWGVRIDKTNFCLAPKVEAIPPEPYEPRDGDEITISTRGHVKDLRDGDYELVGESRMTLSDFHDYDVTVHERGPEPKPKLPTTPGSVVKDLRPHVHNPYLTLQDDGHWWAAGQVRPAPAVSKFDVPIEVIFDAGAE